MREIAEEITDATSSSGPSTSIAMVPITTSAMNTDPANGAL